VCRRLPKLVGCDVSNILFFIIKLHTPQTYLYWLLKFQVNTTKVGAKYHFPRTKDYVNIIKEIKYDLHWKVKNMYHGKSEYIIRLVLITS